MPDAAPNLAGTVHVFFQPARNVPAMAAMGVNVFWGAEVESRSTLTPAAIAAKEAEWVNAVAAVGGKCVLKLGANRPATLPAHCIGLALTADEPNGKGILPVAVRAESDALRAAYPGVPIYLSLAGDKVTSANLRKPAELQLLTDYLAAADVVSVDWYAKNRNANRYPITYTGDAVKTIKAVRPDVKVIPWIEVNDQQLDPPPAPDTNREPTPDEITGTWADALAKGADAPGFFLTCQKGRYGWGDKGDGRGDSYFPQVNRAGASMAPQYLAMQRVARSVNPALPQPPSPIDPAPVPDDRDARIADLTQQLNDANARADLATAHAKELQSALQAILDARKATDAAMANAETAAK